LVLIQEVKFVHIKESKSLIFNGILKLLQILVDNSDEFVQSVTSANFELLDLVLFLREQLQILLSRVHKVLLNLQVKVIKIILFIDDKVTFRVYEVILILVEFIVVVVNFKLILLFAVGTDCHVFNGPVLAKTVANHYKGDSCAYNKDCYQETVKKVVGFLNDLVLDFDSKLSNIGRRRRLNIPARIRACLTSSLDRDNKQTIQI
jgi:hypothetical protein